MEALAARLLEDSELDGERLTEWFGEEKVWRTLMIEYVDPRAGREPESRNVPKDELTRIQSGLPPHPGAVRELSVPLEPIELPSWIARRS